jgi:DNA-binding transcriptional MerR regulator
MFYQVRHLWKTIEYLFFSIEEIAKRVGVSVLTLQCYDKMGLLRAGLTKSGRRCSTTHDVIGYSRSSFLKSFWVPLNKIKANC